MRAELTGILSQRYGESVLPSIKVVEPTPNQVELYNRHHGLLSMWLGLEGDPGLVVIDTADLIHLRHAWIGPRREDSLRLVMSSGVQTASARRRRNETFEGRKVEGLEIALHYNVTHRSIPYLDTLKPLW